MRTGPACFQSAHRTAIIAVLFASFVLLLVSFGFGTVTGDEFSGASGLLVLTPVWMDTPAPGGILTFLLGVSIFILCLVFGGGRTGRRIFHDRTIGSAQGLSGIVSSVAALFRAAISFLWSYPAVRR